MQKMFKGNTICPYTGNVIDSPQCRQCKDYFKAGTWAFIWCKRSETPEPVKPAKTERAKAIEPVKAKRGRKKATGKTTATKSKGQSTGKKRGRPKKAK